MLNLKEKKSSTACPNPKSEDERQLIRQTQLLTRFHFD